MKTLLKEVIFMLFLITVASCSNETTQEEEERALTQLLTEIEEIAESSLPCIDSSEWNYVSYGDTGCGGPVGYIAYSNAIDVDDFLEKVENHRKMQNEFNIKWKILSTCELYS